jgi:hypothetical protein
MPPLAMLQVGLQSQYTASTGTLSLFLGNLHPSLPLSHLSLTPSPACAASAALLAVAVGALPDAIQPKQQVQVQVSLAVLAPFSSSGPLPCLTLAYQVAGSLPVALPLKLPLSPHRFFTPLPDTTKEEFFGKWKSLAGPNKQQVRMIWCGVVPWGGMRLGWDGT